MSLDYGMRVSKPGFDVKSCTDINCVFSSKYTAFKVAISGSIACTANVQASVTHNLGYYPNYYCFVDGVTTETESGVFPMGGDPVVLDWGVSLKTYTSTTQLLITTEDTRTVYYYIFAEKTG